MGLVFLFTLGAALFYLAAALGTGWSLTHPPRRSLAWALAKSQPADPSQLTVARPFRDWTVSSRGLSLRVWEMSGDAPDGPTVILTHGWGDGRVGALARVPAAATFASRIIAWDLPGHGDSDGICTLGTREPGDLRALIAQLPPGDVVLWGWSLGAGVSLAAASGFDHPGLRAIICESAYRHARTPARNVLAARGLPWRINLPMALWALGTCFGVGPRWRGFDRAAIARTLQHRVPLLALHGAQDIVCPPQDAESICSAAHGQLCILPTAGHNDLWTDPAHARVCAEHIAAFMQRVLLNASDAPAHTPPSP